MFLLSCECRIVMWKSVCAKFVSTCSKYKQWVDFFFFTSRLIHLKETIHSKIKIQKRFFFIVTVGDFASVCVWVKTRQVFTATLWSGAVSATAVQPGQRTHSCSAHDLSSSWSPPHDRAAKINRYGEEKGRHALLMIPEQVALLISRDANIFRCFNRRSLSIFKLKSWIQRTNRCMYNQLFGFEILS